MQDIGIKIISNITWRDSDKDFLGGTVLATLPFSVPVIAVRVQTLDEERPLPLAFPPVCRAHVELVSDPLQAAGRDLLYPEARSVKGSCRRRLCLRGCGTAPPSSAAGRLTQIVRRSIMSRGLDPPDERQQTTVEVGCPRRSPGGRAEAPR